LRGEAWAGLASGAGEAEEVEEDDGVVCATAAADAIEIVADMANKVRKILFMLDLIIWI
jgi:hypothetical protein